MQTNGPWKILSSEEKYKNPWMRVQEDRVIRPDGKEGIFGVVQLLDGVTVLPIDENNVAHFTKEFRYAIRRDSIEAASGGRDEGESYLDAAKRELKEELGIVARRWDDLGMIDPLTSVVSVPARMYLVRDFVHEEAKREGTELIDEVKVDFERLVEMVMKSEITHAGTVAVILKAKLFLEKE